MSPALSNQRYKTGLKSGINRNVGMGSFLSILAFGLFKGGELVSRLILARFFTPDDYGLVAYSIAFVYLVVTIIMMGIEFAVIRFMAYHLEKGDEDRATATMIGATLLVGFVGVAVAGVLVVWIDPIAVVLHRSEGFKDLGVMLAFIVLATVFSFLVRGVLIGLQKMRMVVFLSAMEKLVLISWLTVLSISDSMVLKSALIGYALAPLGSVIPGGGIIARRYLNNPVGPRAVVEGIVEILTYSWRIALSSLLKTLRVQGEILILGFFLPIAIVGGYNAASLVAGFMLLPMNGIQKFLISVSSGLFARDEVGEIGALYRLMARWLFMFAVLSIGVLTLAPEDILEVLFGEEYRSYSAIVVLIAFSSLASLVASIQGGLNYAFGMTRVILTCALVGAVSHLGGALWLIPKYGAEGAAVARLTGVILSEGLGVAALFWCYRIQPFQRCHLHLIFIVGVTWFGASMGIKALLFSKLLGIALFVVCSSLLVVWLRIMPREDFIPVLRWVRMKTRLVGENA